VKGPEA